MRYRLVAFVCDGGVVRYSGDLGTSTFHEIFVRREDMCRWAVLMEVGPNAREGYIRADMYNCRTAGEHSEWFHVVLGEHHVFSTEEAALMGAVLQS